AMLLCYYMLYASDVSVFFFIQAEDGIRDRNVTGVQTCALPISIYKRRITKQVTRSRCNRSIAIASVIYCSRSTINSNKKLPGEETLTDEDFSFSKQKEYLDKLVREMMKDGKDINEILNMPFRYMVQLLEEENKPKQVTSVMDLP